MLTFVVVSEFVSFYVFICGKARHNEALVAAAQRRTLGVANFLINHFLWFTLL